MESADPVEAWMKAGANPCYNAPMKSKNSLWQKIICTLPAELEEPASARLIELGAGGVWVEETGNSVRLNVFFPDPVDGRPDVIRDQLTRLAPDGVIGIETAPISEQNWQTAWQSRSVPTQRIGKRLMIVPPWNRRRVKPGSRKIIEISPGMAFGTGTHATTRSCLILLDRMVGPRRIASVLDVGAGSGILAIAAAKLGARRVTAVENDPEALAAAGRNLKLNRVKARVTLRRTIPPRRQFPVVVANLTGPILISQAGAIQRAVRSRGRLILSGITRGEEAEVLRAFRARFSIRGTRRVKDWCTVLLEKNQ